MAVIEFLTITDVSGSSGTTFPDRFMHQGRYSQITIGEVNAKDFGGGTLLIQKNTLNGSLHTVREITEAEYELMIDKTLRLELPDESEITVDLVGATAPNLYIEHRNQKDDRH